MRSELRVGTAENSKMQDGTGQYSSYNFKSELLFASSLFEDIFALWEKSNGSGPAAALKALVQSKQQEWEEAACQGDLPPSQGVTPPHGLLEAHAPRSNIILGRLYAATEYVSTGSGSLEGLKYAPFIVAQLGPLSVLPSLGEANAGVQVASPRPLSAQAPAFRSKLRASDPGVKPRQEDRLGPRDLEHSGRGFHGAEQSGEGSQARDSSEEVVSVSEGSKLKAAGEARERGTAEHQAAHVLEGSAEAGAELCEESRGEDAQDQNDAVGLDSRRLATPPGFISHSGRVQLEGDREEEVAKSESGESHASEQMERRKQRLERKRRQESEAAGGEEDDGLPGSKAVIGGYQTGGEHEGGIGAGEPHLIREGGFGGGGFESAQDLEGEGSCQEGLEDTAEGLLEEESEFAARYDSEGFPEEPSLPTLSADFRALRGGARPAATSAPLKRFSNLRGADFVTGAGSSWAKHISSKAVRKEGGDRQSDVRTDEAYQEYVRKRSAWEEEDRRKRRRMRSKTDFECIERLKGGRQVNTVQGLELHENFLDATEQEKVVRMIHELERLGQQGELRGRTFTAPRKWMRGKGRVTIQFGCCYNYAVDKQGRPPGILQDEAVEPMPLFLEEVVDRMVRWKVMPGGKKRPNSAIINLYSEGDCIPSHIDHHDFDRPFCTMSLLSVANIKFGATMESLDAGVFSGAFEMPLPMGSVCILQGAAADVAKHCIPSVPNPRISVTFRRMRPEKAPYTNIVLPPPHHPVFHEHVFPPSQITPPPGLPFAHNEPPEAPPLDISAEAWPDLSGQTAGGPVEAAVARPAGQKWAGTPPTRPPSGEGPVSSSAVQVADWPDLRAGARTGPGSRSASLERSIRPSSGNGALSIEPLPPNQSKASSSNRVGRERSSPGSWRPAAELGREERAFGQDAPASGPRSSPNPQQSPPVSGGSDYPPSEEALVSASEARPSNQSQGQRTPEAMTLEKRPASSPEPNPRTSETTDEGARSSEAGASHHSNGKASPKTRALEPLEAPGGHSFRHSDVQHEAASSYGGREGPPNGSAGSRHVATGYRSGGAGSRTPGRGRSEERGAHPSYSAPAGNGHFSNGPVSTDSPFSTPSDREENPQPGSQFSTPSNYNGNHQPVTFSISEPGYTRRLDEGGRNSYVSDSHGSEVRGWSADRRYMSSERQNGWARGGASAGVENRYLSQGRGDRNRSPRSQPADNGGRSLPRQHGYQQGVQEENGRQRPYANGGFGNESSGYVQRAAPTSAPPFLVRSNSGPGGHSHRVGPQNGSGSGGYSHQENRPNGFDVYLHQLGLETLPSGSGSEAYSHQDSSQAKQQERVPVVDASCVFDQSPIASASQWTGDDEARSLASAASPQPSFALFFPKETPKKAF